MKNQESGRSMIEMLGVLAIIGVLSVGGLSVYSQAMHRYKVAQVSSQVVDTIEHVKKLYSGEHIYAHLLDYVRNNAMSVTAFDVEGNTLKHAMGGTALVRQCSRRANDTNEAFCIAIKGLQKKECVDLLTQRWGGGIFAVGAVRGPEACYEESGILDTSENAKRTSPVHDGDALIAYKGAMPVSPVDAVQVCSETGNLLFFKIR